MSLQWTFIATVLYCEIFMCLLLMFPYISARRWQKIFRSSFIKAFTSHASLYFGVFVVILLVLFADAARDVIRYGAPLDETDLKNNPAAETTLHMKLFRSQRNLYIAGFALFLLMVLRRLVTLVSTQATLEAEANAAQQQAKSATEAAKAFMEEKQNMTNEGNKDINDQLEKKKLEVMKLREELAAAEANVDAMKKQAEGINTEYDRLLKENTKLQDLVKKLEGSSGTKKDD